MGVLLSCCNKSEEKKNPILTTTLPTQPEKPEFQQQQDKVTPQVDQQKIDQKDKQLLQEQQQKNQNGVEKNGAQDNQNSTQKNQGSKPNELGNAQTEARKKLIEIEKLISSSTSQGSKKQKLTIKDFEVLGMIGKGAFGVVQLVIRKSNPGKQYAMKVIKKSDLVKYHIQKTSKIEREIMVAGIKHPNIVQLKYCFQTNSKIYYVMEYMGGGELYKYLRGQSKFNEEDTRFILAQVVLALEFLHTKQKLIYRDLKPENILLGLNGYIKLADFGLSKHFKDKDELTYTFAGTQEYLAPEVLFSKGYNKDCDLWALGVFCFELLHGKCPFPYKQDQLENLKKYVIQNEPRFGNISDDAKDFIKKLLMHDPKKRLGSDNMEDIKKHPFFKGINFDDIYNCKAKSPLLKLLLVTQQKQNRMVQPRAIYETPGANFPNIPGLTFTGSQNLETIKV